MRRFETGRVVIDYKLFESGVVVVIIIITTSVFIFDHSQIFCLCPNFRNVSLILP